MRESDRDWERARVDVFQIARCPDALELGMDPAYVHTCDVAISSNAPLFFMATMALLGHLAGQMARRLCQIWDAGVTKIGRISGECPKVLQSRGACWGK